MRSGRALPNHTVIFNNNGGTGAMANEVNNVPAALTTDAFTRAGFTFAGWNTAADGSGTSYADGASYAFAADATMFAQWTAIPNKTVTFNNNGGTGSMANEVNNVPTRSDRRHLHPRRLHLRRLEHSGERLVARPMPTAPPTRSLSTRRCTRSGHAIRAKTVTFNSNGGSGSMADEFNNVAAPAVDRHVHSLRLHLRGLEHRRDGSGTAFADGASYPFTADATMFAQWTRDPEHDGDLQQQRRHRVDGERDRQRPTALTANTFTRAGFAFTGWNTAANGSGTAYADGASYAFTA